MTRVVTPSALHALYNPTTTSDQIAALRQIKNEIVGHDQRKELVVTKGIIAPLARILGEGRKRDGKRKRFGEVNGNGARPLETPSAHVFPAGHAEASANAEAPWSQEEEMRLQAILVLGSLGLGGSRFVAALLAGNAIQPLLDTLSPSENSPKLVHATLRTLITIVESISRVDATFERNLRHRIHELIFAKPAIQSYMEIISRRTIPGIGRTEVALTAQLIATCCVRDDDRNGYKALLVKSGILDHLAARLAVVLPTAQAHTSYVASLLDAIAAITEGSNYRVARFIYSQPILSLAPIFSASHNGSPAPSNPPQSRQSSPPKAVSLDQLGLPKLQSQQKSEPTANRNPFPQFAASLSAEARRPEVLQLVNSTTRLMTGDDFDSPIFLWLIHFARKERGLARLSAIKMIALLKKFIDEYPTNEDSRPREKALAYLLVPILLRMIDEASPRKDGKSRNDPAESRAILESAPSIFATLCEETKSLQVSSIDAGAVKIISQLLRRTFDPVQPVTKPLWRADAAAAAVGGKGMSYDPALGVPGFSAEATHALRVRLGALRALSAISESEDSHRKHTIETGVVPFVAQSLVPQISDVDPQFIGTSAKDGNSDEVLIAACRCAMTLSRSVMMLRTSMLDNGLVQPIYKLLQHSNMEVQIAAVDALCNFMLEFSPMREEILEAEALTELCNRVHSADMTMRISALWALKHFVLPSNTHGKTQALEKVGVGWLVNTLEADLRHPPTSSRHHSRVSTAHGLGTSNAAGERVSLLNAMDIDDDSDQLDSDDDSYSDPMEVADSDPKLSPSSRVLPTPKFLRSTNRTQIYKRLRTIKAHENDPAFLAHRDELRIQEQCLDLVCNLMADPAGQNLEMIDSILSSFGRDRLFSLLTQKLSHHASPSAGLTASSSTAPHSIPGAGAMLQPTPLILATLRIVMHLANGTPSHRALVIAQSALLHSLLPLFAHPDHRVRVGLVWTMNNLAWLDDSSDVVAQCQRVEGLRRAGLEDKVKALLVDGVLDVRERAKSCLELMAKAGLGGREGRGGGSGEWMRER